MYDISTAESTVIGAGSSRARRPIVELRRVTKSYPTVKGEFTAIGGVTLDVYEGEFLAIVGPSGCGKSTLLSMIAGLNSFDSGEIRVRGQAVVPGEPVKNLGYMFQEDTVLPWYSVERNIALGMRYRKYSADVIARKIEWALQVAKLGEFRAAYPHQLSGGMRRRLALVMTLVTDPEILLMDEPFGALDTHTKTSLHRNLLEIWEKTRQTTVFVTHDLMEAITLADRVIIMGARPGRVLECYEVTVPRPRDVIAVKDSEEYLHDFREIWRILGSEFVS